MVYPFYNSLVVFFYLLPNNIVFSQGSVSTIKQQRQTIIVNGKEVFLNGIYYNVRLHTGARREQIWIFFKAVGMNMIEMIKFLTGRISESF